MPVVPRNFCFHMAPSLCKSVECESLSLFVASPVGSLYPHCVPSQSMVVWNIIRCLMWFYRTPTHRPFGPPPTVSTVTTRPTPLTSLPNAEVMIGNTVLYLVYAHNQTLPNNTIMNTLAEQPTWCIWSFGAGTYQSLPSAHARPLVCLVLWSGSLPMLTILYQPIDLGGTSGLIAFTSRRSPLGGITHSTMTMCYVVLLWLIWLGDHRHLSDVGSLIVWTAILIYKCLGLTDGMEVWWVLGKTIECGLTIDNWVQGLRHGHLHRLGVVVLVWFIVWHIQLLCYALIVAQNRAQSMWV